MGQPGLEKRDQGQVALGGLVPACDVIPGFWTVELVDQPLDRSRGSELGRRHAWRDISRAIAVCVAARRTVICGMVAGFSIAMVTPFERLRCRPGRQGRRRALRAVLRVPGRIQVPQRGEPSATPALSGPASPGLIAQIVMAGETAVLGKFRPAWRPFDGGGVVCLPGVPEGPSTSAARLSRSASAALMVVKRPIAQARAGKSAARRLGPTGPAFSSFSSQCAGMLSRKAENSKFSRGCPAAIRS